MMTAMWFYIRMDMTRKHNKLIESILLDFIINFYLNYFSEDDRRQNGSYSQSNGEEQNFINPATFLVDDKDSDSDNHPGSDETHTQQKQTSK